MSKHRHHRHDGEEEMASPENRENSSIGDTAAVFEKDGIALSGDTEAAEEDLTSAEEKVVWESDNAAAAEGEGEKAKEAADRPGTVEAILTPQKLLNQLKLYREELAKVRNQLHERDSELDIFKKSSQDISQKLKDEHEARLRTAADLENYRRRAIREREDVAKYGQEKLVKGLLPILDNLERALDPQNSRDPEALRQGVEMTLKMFEQCLGDIGVKGVVAVGQQFDPQFHEALQAVESDEPPGTIVKAMGRAYTMHDRLIRPAIVFVAKPRENSAGQPSPAAQGTAAAEQGGEEIQDTSVEQTKTEVCSSDGEDAKECRTENADT